MNFVIISHVLHKTHNESLYAYAPYIREMNLWLKHVNKVEIVAPLSKNKDISQIEIQYKHNKVKINSIPQIQFTSIKSSIASLLKLPIILSRIFKACKKADHIHLRCPGNIGLLGCFVQICFPNKIKTAKYAGNWDPKSKQPLSYRIQKNILSNTFFTKNMQTLVYGNWENQTKNIKSFFTATYYNSEIEEPVERDYSNKLKFVFIGSLVEGKRPMLAIKIIEELKKSGKDVSIELYGDGPLKNELLDYIEKQQLVSFVFLKGNQQKEVIKQTLKEAHFLLLSSKSEGWPKVVAEAMFFGVIPIVTKISCVPYMLDFGKRGVLIEPKVQDAVNQINLKPQNDLKLMSKLASNWSQNYTLDVFENEIKKLLKP